IEGRPVFGVRRFVEKPDAATAESYLRSGEYFWNAGMFVWRVSAIERAFGEHAPELAAGLRELEAGLEGGGDFTDLLARIYPDLKRISIDYAMMEKARNVVTLAA